MRFLISGGAKSAGSLPVTARTAAAMSPRARLRIVPGIYRISPPLSSRRGRSLDHAIAAAVPAIRIAVVAFLPGFGDSIAAGGRRHGFAAPALHLARDGEEKRNADDENTDCRSDRCFPFFQLTPPECHETVFRPDRAAFTAPAGIVFHRAASRYHNRSFIGIRCGAAKQLLPKNRVLYIRRVHGPTWRHFTCFTLLSDS